MILRMLVTDGLSPGATRLDVLSDGLAIHAAEVSADTPVVTATPFGATVIGSAVLSAPSLSAGAVVQAPTLISNNNLDAPLLTLTCSVLTPRYVGESGIWRRKRPKECSWTVADSTTGSAWTIRDSRPPTWTTEG